MRFVIWFVCLRFGIKLDKDAKAKLRRLIKEWRKTKQIPKEAESFVQENIPNEAVLKIYDWLGKRLRISGKNKKQNLQKNLSCGAARALCQSFESGFLGEQGRFTDMRFGKSTVADAGCEVMAVYNALHALGKPVDYDFFCRLLQEFEKKGAAVWAKAGTAPRALMRYFEREGYMVIPTTAESGTGTEKELQKAEKEIKKVEESAQVYIATVYNSRTDIFQEIHTVCIEKKKEGFVVYNAYAAAGKHFPDLKSAIAGISYMEPKPLFLFGIRDKADGGKK